MKKKKKAFTLLEIMIVIFLIGLIGSVVGYNMKGTLKKGKIFKTEQAKARLEDILSLQLAIGEATTDEVINKTEKVLEKSGYVKKPSNLLVDGWGEKFDIQVNGDEVTVSSIHSE